MKIDPEIRCPACSRLLAKRLKDGSYVVRENRSRATVVFRAGSVQCNRCETIVELNLPLHAVRDLRAVEGRFQW